MSIWDEEVEDTNTDTETESSEENVRSDDWGDTESEEEQGYDDDERD